jgi:hypoxanthine phosphoribosyltransferase
MDPKDWIDVTTEKNHYFLDHFVIPNHYEQDVSSILIPHGVIMVTNEKKRIKGVS